MTAAGSGLRPRTHHVTTLKVYLGFGHLAGKVLQVLVQDRKAAAKVRYRPKDDFHQRLQSEVGAVLLRDTRQARRRLAVKIVVTSSWFYGAYACLVLLHLRTWQAGLLTVSLGLSGAAVAMGTAHDAVHGTISKSRRINAAVALLAAPFGISRTWWKAKHNQLHHSFTNVHGVDDDLHFGRLLRLTPHQRWHGWHRYQHVYAWLLYPFLYLAMLGNGDVAFITRGVIGTTQVARPTPGRAVRLLGEKLAGLVLLVGLAAVTHPLVHVLAVYLAAAALAGFVMAAVFQTGHCLDTSTFLNPEAVTGEVHSGWALAQVAGTADVATSNRLYTMFTGGLNYHVEHHLFPQANQMLLPAIAAVVRRQCAANGVDVVVLPTIGAAVRSHQRLLRRLGRGPAVDTPVLGDGGLPNTPSILPLPRLARPRWARPPPTAVAVEPGRMPVPDW